jgi:hypothetical protein
VQGLGDGGTGHHDDDCGDDSLGQQQSAARLRTPRCYPKGRDGEHAQRFGMRVTPDGTRQQRLSARPSCRSNGYWSRQVITNMFCKSCKTK